MDAIDTVMQDLRYTARTLRRNPGFAGVAVLTLALGIGANTAVFSLIDGILLSPLPYAAPAELLSVTGVYPGGAFAAMRDEMTSLDVAAYAEGQTFTLMGNGEPARVNGARVSAELFPVLGVKPALGRWLRPGEDAAPNDRSIVLSHDLWAARFGSDPAIVGRFVDLDGVNREVVAVMPPSFRFPAARTQVWVPLGLDPRDTARYWAGDFMPVVRPPASRRDAVAGARGDRRVSIARAHAVSVVHAGGLESRRQRDPAARRDRRRRAIAAAGAGRGRRARARDCVRERGEPESGAGDRARARNRHSRRHRRGAAAHRAPAAHRERRAGHAGGGGRGAVRHAGDRAAQDRAAA
jgi:hypothetical protein